MKEQNTVLSEKLEQREATIDELQDRIETLEAELAALRSPGSDEKSCEQSARQAETEDEPESEQSSVWSRVKGFVGNAD